MKRLASKKLLVILIVAAAIAAGLVVLHNRNHHSNRVQPLLTKNNTTAKSQPAKTSTQGEGGAIDTHGSDAGTSPKTKPAMSTSGIISVNQPAANAKLSSGDILGGTAKVDTIQFRLIDNVVGVIAQGSLKVVDDKYSGSLRFQPRGTAGRLDVFSLDPTTGAEINEVQIPVSL